MEVKKNIPTVLGKIKVVEIKVFLKIYKVVSFFCDLK